VYAETADLHERFAPGNPDWSHPHHMGDRASRRYLSVLRVGRRAD
jgi:hypothetical protein